MLTAFIAAAIVAVLGLGLVANIGRVSDRLGEYGRQKRAQRGLAAPGMTSADQLKTAGWAVLLVVVPVLIVIGIINAHR